MAFIIIKYIINITERSSEPAHYIQFKRSVTVSANLCGMLTCDEKCDNNNSNNNFKAYLF